MCNKLKKAVDTAQDGKLSFSLSATDQDLLSTVMIPIAFQQSRGREIQKYADANKIQRAAADRRWGRLREKFQKFITDGGGDEGGSGSTGQSSKKKQPAAPSTPRKRKAKAKKVYDSDSSDDDDEEPMGLQTPSKTPKKAKSTTKKARTSSPSPGLVADFKMPDDELAAFSDSIQMLPMTPEQKPDLVKVEEKESTDMPPPYGVL